MKKFLLTVSILFLTVFLYSEEFIIPDFTKDFNEIIMEYVQKGYKSEYFPGGKFYVFIPKELYIRDNEIKKIEISDTNYFCYLKLFFDTEEELWKSFIELSIKNNMDIGYESYEKQYEAEKNNLRIKATESLKRIDITYTKQNLYLFISD